MESCQLKCYRTEACQYWVWNKANSRCFLKSEKHEENRLNHHNFITSAKHCFKCAVWGSQYPGNELPNMPVYARSSMDCQMICQRNNDCKYWGWKMPNCYLNNGKNEAGKTPAASNYAYGPKYC